ncbi:hypothetical protein [Lysinibacillus sp. FSL P4-0201]|uniref:hypothetical protein n=1 Tax=Lysinibacillus sp. FSL P4-0201 TaxID=2921721 RepID=UPI00315B2957
MFISKVMFEMNRGKSIENMAEELGMDVIKLNTKLKNAAVEFDEVKKIWDYYGSNAEESLNRDIKKTVKVKDVDRAFVDRHKQTTKVKDVPKKDFDFEYTLFKDYLDANNKELNSKKTFTLNEEIYDTIKELSKKKSMKINVLINVLLAKGLGFYNIEIVDNKSSDTDNKPTYNEI